MKRVTTSDAGKGAGELDLPSINSGVDAMQPRWRALVVLCKTKFALAVQIRKCPLEHLSQRNKTLCSHQNRYTDTPSSFIHHSPELEATRSPPTGPCSDEPWCTHHTGCHSAVKRHDPLVGTPQPEQG